MHELSGWWVAGDWLSYVTVDICSIREKDSLTSMQYDTIISHPLRRRGIDAVRVSFSCHRELRHLLARRLK